MTRLGDVRSIVHANSLDVDALRECLYEFEDHPDSVIGYLKAIEKCKLPITWTGVGGVSPDLPVAIGHSSDNTIEAIICVGDYDMSIWSTNDAYLHLHRVMLPYRRMAAINVFEIIYGSNEPYEVYRMLDLVQKFVDGRISSNEYIRHAHALHDHNGIYRSMHPGIVEIDPLDAIENSTMMDNKRVALINGLISPYHIKKAFDGFSFLQ